MTNSNADEASLSALQFHDEPQHETVVFIYYFFKLIVFIIIVILKIIVYIHF